MSQSQDCTELLSAPPLLVPVVKSPLSVACPWSLVLALADRLIGLPEGRARNHNRPQQVPVLAGIFIEDIAVGAEHTLALSSTGDVYAWGSNSEGQVRPIPSAPDLQEPLIVLHTCAWHSFLLVEIKLLFSRFSFTLQHDCVLGNFHYFLVYSLCSYVVAVWESTLNMLPKLL